MSTFVFQIVSDIDNGDPVGGFFPKSFLQCQCLTKRNQICPSGEQVKNMIAELQVGLDVNCYVTF